MTDTNPTDNYTKAKRITLAASGLLTLAVMTGISGRIPIIGLQIEDQQQLQYIFLLMMGYGVFQLWTNWYLQNDAVQKSSINKWDFRITGIISYIALGFFLHHQFSNFLCTLFNHESCAWWFGGIYTGISAITFVATVIGVEHVSNTYHNTTKAREKKIFESLTSDQWILYYSPESQKPNRNIGFNINGLVENSDKKNKNEHTWRIKNGYLEILNTEYEVHSRFQFNESCECFEHTNDRDTLSLKSQIICKSGAKT